MKVPAPSGTSSGGTAQGGKTSKGKNAPAGESAALLSALVDSVMDGVILMDARQRIVRLNPAAEKIFGCSEADMLGKSIKHLIPRQLHKQRSRNMSFFADAKVTRTAAGVVHVWIAGRRASGEEFPIEMSISRFESEGKAYFAAIARDISERAGEENTLRSSVSLYRLLAEAVDDMIMIIGSQGRLEYVNDPAAGQLGSKPEEIVGKHIDELFPEEIARRQYENVKKVVSSGNPAYVEAPSQFPGRLVWLGTSLTPLRDKTGRVYAVLGVSRDITSRKQAEEILRVSEAEYRSLFENALEGIYRTSPDGKILTANPALIKMLGFDSMEELLHMDFSHELYLRPENRNTVRRVMAEADEQRNVELSLQRKDGQRLIVLNNSRTVRDADGTVLYYEGTMVDITERKRAVEQLNRRVAELEALYESGLALGQSLEPREVAGEVIAVLAKRLDWDHAAVWLKQESADGILCIAFSSAQAHAAGEAMQPARHGLVGWVIEHGKVLRSGDLGRDRRHTGAMPGMLSGIYSPMKIGERTIGCVSVESPEAQAFTESDERLVATISAQAAIGIENARLFAQTRQRLEQVSALHQIDSMISSSADLRSVLELVLEHVLVQLNVDAASVLLLDPATLTLRFAHGMGFRTTNMAGLSFRLGEDQAGRAALERRPIFISNLKEQRQAFSHPSLFEGEDFLGYACMPLIAKDQATGVLEVYSRTALARDDEWQDFFTVLAGQTAVAIDSSTMFEDLQRSHLELSQAYDATIEGWSRALDLRDGVTEGHTQRVTDLTIRLARRLGISESDIVHLRRGALLHDIGKMGVPDTILNKPGPLTTDELQIMRRHPQYAYTMLMPISYLRLALDIPYDHHEKWDGSGYPRGLKGYAIPVAARIFAVCDVFDALTSDRPYRKAWSVDVALAYLREQSGRHFALEVVDTFLSMIDASRSLTE